MMAEKKVAILGGRGMLGTDVAMACKGNGYEAEVFDLPEFDITNSRDLKKAVKSAEAIVNCAAYTNVDGAESEYDLAYTVNAAAAGRLGEFSKKAGVWVLHISTDFVFDGALDRPYIETDSANPINAYGKTKLIGEQMLVGSGCRACILRIQWTYGKAGKNFITKLISLAKERKELRVVDDQMGSPTATADVAKAMCVLLGKRPEGVFHFADSGYASRYDAARFVFEKLNIAVDLQRCKSSDYKTAAQRPLNSRFCCDKIQALLDEPIGPWEKSLAKFLRQL